MVGTTGFEEAVEDIFNVLVFRAFPLISARNTVIKTVQ